MFPLRRELPEKFHAIKMIRSVEIRHKLTRRIIMIHELLSILSAFEMSVKTKSLLDKFFSYLIDSCSSPDKIERRSIWLLEYGGIVEDHLGILEERFNRRQSFVEDPQNEDLIRKIIALVETVSLYRVQVRAYYENDPDVIDMLSFILDLANKTDAHHDRGAYFDIQERVDNIVNGLTAMMASGSVGGIDYEYMLISRLMGIRYRLIRYTMWQGYISPH